MTASVVPTDISPDVLTDGHWETVRGIQRWVGELVVIACPTCHARADQMCRTASGHTTTPHGGRLIPRCCPCGAQVKGRRWLCDPCRSEATRQSNRLSRERRRAS